MTQTQNDIAIRALGLLLERQARPKIQKGPEPKKLGTIRHIDRCRSALPKEVREIYDSGKFDDEGIKILRPYLTSVSIFYQETLPKGKVWPKAGGAKEAARAEKRLAKAA